MALPAFKLSPAKDTLLVASGAALVTAGLLLTHNNEPPSPADISSLSLSDIMALDGALMFDYSQTLSSASDVSQYTLFLLPALFLLSRSPPILGTIGAMYGESMLLAFGLKDILKSFTGRYRPYAYQLSAETLLDGETTLSFPSGHATMAFANAVFCSYAFTKVFPDSRLVAPVWIGSLSLATLTGVLRVLSGNHFATDVLAGACIGAASGFLIPLIHMVETRTARPLAVSISPRAMLGGPGRPTRIELAVSLDLD